MHSDDGFKRAAGLGDGICRRLLSFISPYGPPIVAGYVSLLSGCSLDEMRSTGRALLVAAGVLILTNRLALVPRRAEC